MSRAREPIIFGGTVIVPLTQGYFAILDLYDIGILKGRNWSALVSKRRVAVYACRVENKRMLLLHREVMQAAPGSEVDHRNGDGLDCRRENLRFCTRSQNVCNSPLRSDNRARLKGAFWDERSKKWRAEITVAGARRHIGLFASPDEAHAAYIAAATKSYGEFARKA